jgi:hypothetical protein
MQPGSPPGCSEPSSPPLRGGVMTLSVYRMQIVIIQLIRRFGIKALKQGVRIVDSAIHGLGGDVPTLL